MKRELLLLCMLLLFAFASGCGSQNTPAAASAPETAESMTGETPEAPASASVIGDETISSENPRKQRQTNHSRKLLPRIPRIRIPFFPMPIWKDLLQNLPMMVSVCLSLPKPTTRTAD